MNTWKRNVFISLVSSSCPMMNFWKFSPKRKTQQGKLVNVHVSMPLDLFEAHTVKPRKQEHENIRTYRSLMLCKKIPKIGTKH